MAALGLDPAALPGWWQGWPPRLHVQRWRDELGLAEAEIIAAAEASRQEHPEPPDGPKALDRAMQRAAQRKVEDAGRKRRKPKAPPAPALTDAEAATAERKQAYVLRNPTVDGTWGTIPVGPTNPEGLSSPLTKIPSYGVGVSYTFLQGKRAPRQRQAVAEEEAAKANVNATVRGQAIELARVLGEMAVATLRVDGLRELVDQQNANIVLLESRVSSGFATPLDLDRLRIERAHTEQQVFGNEVDLRRAQAACAAIVATRCGAFGSAADARAFLEAWTRRAEASDASPEKRPDVRALDAQRRADSEICWRWLIAANATGPLLERRPRSIIRGDGKSAFGGQSHGLLLVGCRAPRRPSATPGERSRDPLRRMPGIPRNTGNPSVEVKYSGSRVILSAFGSS